MKLLTIAIPTFNRAGHLQGLLEALQRQCEPLADTVTVIVANNASTDNTHAVIESIQTCWPELHVITQPTNIGSDGNFETCLTQCQTPYFWLIGDDDLPAPGLVKFIVARLRDQQPDMIYIPANWVDDVAAHSARTISPTEKFHIYAAPAFARHVSAWLTFISGIVVKLDHTRMDSYLAATGKYRKSHLIHLAWVLHALKEGSNFLCMDNYGILATKNNSGGYPVITVFGVNFPKILRQELGPTSPLAEIIIQNHAKRFLPGLIWKARIANSTFMQESPWVECAKQLGHLPYFWTVLLPVGLLPAAFLKYPINARRTLLSFMQLHLKQRLQQKSFS